MLDFSRTNTEWIDPVRFVSNPSTGKMGYALTEEAVRGASRSIWSAVRCPCPLPRVLESITWLLQRKWKRP